MSDLEKQMRELAEYILDNGPIADGRVCNPVEHSSANGEMTSSPVPSAPFDRFMRRVLTPVEE